MEPITWILGIVLVISGAGNWIQNGKIDDKANEVKDISTQLQKANDDLIIRDKKLIEAEVAYNTSRRRFGDSLQQQGFIIHAQAKSLRDKHSDTPHKVHERTTKSFSTIMGTPKDPASKREAWDSEYLSKQKAELIKSKALEKAALEEAKDLRDQLREAQKRESQLLDDLDDRADELVEMTDKNVGLFSQIQNYITYAIWAGIVFGLVYAWTACRGFWFKHVSKKYHSAIETFSLVGDEGNEMAANVLQDLKLKVPPTMQKHLFQQKYANTSALKGH